MLSLAIAAQTSAQSAPAVIQLVAALDRLRTVVVHETRTLRERGSADLQTFSHSKSQGLLEVSRAMRALGRTAPDPAVRDGLAALRASLDENHAVLALHLRATEEVAATLSRALEHAESDGTYSPLSR